MKTNSSVFSFILFLLALASIARPSASKPVQLRCEYLTNPLGIDCKNPRLTWRMDDERMGAKQTAYEILVGTDSLKLTEGKAGQWNSGRINSDKMLVAYRGTELQAFTRYYWRVAIWDQNNQKWISDVAFFEMGMVSVESWKGAWISDHHDINYKPVPYFRTVFQSTKKINTARVYISSAGLNEVYINGEKIGDHVLDPMYTRFDRRLLYVTYDVTSKILNGENAIGVILGNGWYNHQSTAVWDFHKATWRRRPTFCLDLRITYADGSVRTISSGKNWKTSTGPIVFNSIYTAEHYDARLEQQDWYQPAFDDSQWKDVIFRSAPAKNIVAQAMHPIRYVEELPARSIAEINDSSYVVDFGRNISGVTEFSVQANEGVVFHLKHGERLGKDGRVDISNIEVHYHPKDDSDPFQTDIYVANGQGTEVFRPHFNYKGFQYVEVTSSVPVNLTKDNFKAYFMHSDVPEAGRISASSEMLNKLLFATNNSYLSNLFGYPTDCPQREKNGWTGDAQIAIETGLYNYDGITIYEKWLADHQDEQQPNGVLPAIIPSNGWGYEWANGPDWTSTIAIIPWTIYLFYGDDHLLAQCYENIKRYVDHINDVYPSGLTDWGLGDWIPVKSKSPVELTSSVYYYLDTHILASAAKLFGKASDYKKYATLAEKIKKAINAKYLNEQTGIYGSGLQTELSVPLYWGVVPPELKRQVAKNLAKRIEADGDQLDVGLLGTKAILGALSQNGQAQTAYDLASRETYPSWGWWVVNGATTLYENWEIDAQSDISMNHIMFGHIGAWFYKVLVGINPDPKEPGFKNILLSPYFPDDLDEISAYHDSMYGRIVSHWKKEGDEIMLEVTIPPNSTADLVLPQKVRIKKINGKDRKNKTELKLESGTYEMVLEQV